MFNCLESWGQELNCQDKVLSYEFLLVPICRDDKVTKDVPKKCKGGIMWYFFRKATCNLLEVVKKAAVVAPRNSLSSRRREGNGMNKGETQGTVYHMDEDQAENLTQHHIKCRKSWFKIFQHGDVSRLSRLIYYCRCSKGYCRIIIEPQEGRQ